MKNILAHSNTVPFTIYGITVVYKIKGSFLFKERFVSVLYQMEMLSGPMKKFIDPNEIDPEGLTSLRNYSFSMEGTYCCYGLSFGGSDWCELKFRNCESGEDLPDVLQQVKFSSISWTKDEKGVFYCMYPQHKGKADGTETTTNTDQKLMYHRLGTPQSDDILCVERPDQPTWNMYV